MAARRVVLDAEDVALTEQPEGEPTTAGVGEEKSVAILFADIRGFTPFCEDVPPYVGVRVLNHCPGAGADPRRAAPALHAAG